MAQGPKIEPSEACQCLGFGLAAVEKCCRPRELAGAGKVND